MNGDTSQIITQFFPLFTAVVGALAGAFLNNVYNIKNQRENIRREKLSKSYFYILKYINTIQDITTKDVLNDMKDSSKYEGLETSIIIDIMDCELKDYYKDKDKYTEEIKELEKSIELLQINEKTYKEACIIKDEFLDQEFVLFNLYASKEVKKAWFKLYAVVHGGYNRNRDDQYKAFVVENNEKDYKNVFFDAYEKLYQAIRKDLGIKNDNDLISK